MVLTRLPPSCEQDSRRPSDGPWNREENKQGLLCCEPQMLGNCLNREQFKWSLLWPVFKHQVVMRTECLVLLPRPPLGFSTHSRSQRRPAENNGGHFHRVAFLLLFYALVFRECLDWPATTRNTGRRWLALELENLLREQEQRNEKLWPVIKIKITLKCALFMVPPYFTLLK